MLPGTPPGPHGTFDGGYAQVIRATDYPAPPSSRIQPANPGRSAGPPGPARPERPTAPIETEVFVYRDTGGQPDGPADGSPGRDPAEHDAAYWYDLLAEDTAPRREETRGPFEPLVSSSRTPAGPGAAPTGTGPAGTGPAGTGPTGTAPGQPPADDTAQARARKLEQLKDLYLTAQAIGEENVDKHFDHILAKQRELISEYFRQSAAARPDGPQSAVGGQAGTPEGAGVAAEQPQA